MFRQHALASVIALVSLAGAAHAATLEELAAQVKAQQAQIDALVAAAEKPAAGSPFANTSVGSYGEANFSHLDGSDDGYDGYRFVLTLGHQFSDKVRAYGELELEHSFLEVDGETQEVEGHGEVELEQLFVEWNYLGEQKLTVGQILVPVGILNETHEPDTFYGVHRNIVETDIIPTTWWEGGVKASGDVVPGLSYDLFLSTGLKTEDGEGDVREARQKGAEALAEDYAYTGRIKYTGVKGLELGLTYQRQTDITQGKSPIGEQDQPADLWEAHVAYQIAAFQLRALWAKWDIDGLDVSEAQHAEQEGWYLEPSYKLLDNLGVFAHFAEVDLAAADTADSKVQQWNYGVNFYPAQRVVLKLDVQDQKLSDAQVAAGEMDADGFLLGVGYSF